ncbi:hypothetical protein INT43_006679 [Umbelopsis isabellina]|uniref:Hyaluronan/mRNA-binding protein domain-containing protein n=1 Tax=Mortierella isabellina TaxID=91625 RepID=A0A8H7Q0Q7_MORIS|nr:hypothetical protein INT43_006679 [Umbelopsis isabellina]
MSAFSKNLFELLGDSDNEAPAAASAPAAKQAAQPAVKEQAARPKTEKSSKRGGKSDEATLLNQKNVPPCSFTASQRRAAIAGNFPIGHKPLCKYQQSPSLISHNFFFLHIAPRGRRPEGGARREGGKPPRRQFDRHSATGLVDSEKKVEQGWGHAESAEAEAATDSVKSSDPAAPEAEAAVEEEPEEETKTLEEYLASKKAAGPAALPEARKPNEGADDAKWKDAVALEKPEEEDFFGGKGQALKQKNKTKKEKVHVEIEQRFVEENKRGGFRGGERGERGGRGGNRGAQRGGQRGGRGGQRRGGRQSAAVNLNDASAFPTLGA